MASSLFFPFHAFFAGRIARWLLYNPAFKGRKGLLYALLFLAGAALVHLVSERVEQPANYYNTLGANIGSTLEEMKRAYKQRSLELHPDKNRSPTAQEEFTRLREAFEVLSDATSRDRYGRFGPDYVKPTPSGDSPVIGAAVTFYGSLALWR